MKRKSVRIIAFSSKRIPIFFASLIILAITMSGCQLASRPNDQTTQEQLTNKIESMQPQPAGEVKFLEVIGSTDAVHFGAYSFSDDLFEYTARGDNQLITTIFRKGSPEESPSVIRSQLEMDQLAIKLFMTNFASLPLKTVTRKVIRDYSGLYMVEVIELLDEQTQSGLKAAATFTSDGQLMDMTFISSRIDKVPAASINEEQARVQLIGYMEAEFLNKRAIIGGDVVKVVYDQSSDPYAAYNAEHMTFGGRVSWLFTLPIIIDTSEGRIYKTAIQANIDVTNGELIGGVAKAGGYRIVK